MTRYQRIRAILDKRCPYRVSRRTIMGILDAIPDAGERFQSRHDMTLAAFSALPFRIVPSRSDSRGAPSA